MVFNSVPSPPKLIIKESDELSLPPDNEEIPEEENTIESLFEIYTVMNGDNLSAISELFNINIDYILWNNPELSSDPDLLVEGQLLVIPSYDGLLYEVRLGDNLSNIASFYNSDIDSIINFAPNNISAENSIIEGLTLLLPNATLPEPEIIPDPTPTPIPNDPPPNDPPPNDPPPNDPGTGILVWPLVGPISSHYGEDRGNGWIHNGIDIDGWGRHGAPIVAAAAGSVTLVSWQEWGYGNHVVIRHEDNSETLYAHLSDMNVTPGQNVTQGETIGAVGSTGHSTGTHLHFELIINGIPVS